MRACVLVLCSAVCGCRLTKTYSRFGLLTNHPTLPEMRQQAAEPAERGAVADLADRSDVAHTPYLARTIVDLHWAAWTRPVDIAMSSESHCSTVLPCQ